MDSIYICYYTGVSKKTKVVIVKNNHDDILFLCWEDFH